MAREIDDLKRKVTQLECKITELRIQEAETRGRDRMIAVTVAILLGFSQGLFFLYLQRSPQVRSEQSETPSSMAAAIDIKQPTKVQDGVLVCPEGERMSTGDKI